MKTTQQLFELWFPTETRPYFNKEEVDKLHNDVMDGKMGIRVRFIGNFWNVKGIEDTLYEFHEFVSIHNARIQVTWEARHPGGCIGVQFFGARIEDCQAKKDKT